MTQILVLINGIVEFGLLEKQTKRTCVEQKGVGGEHKNMQDMRKASAVIISLTSFFGIFGVVFLNLEAVNLHAISLLCLWKIDKL